jgi:hypothetical protein
MGAWIPWAIAAVLLAVLLGLTVRNSMADQQRLRAQARELAEARRELRSRAKVTGEMMRELNVSDWPPR